MLPNTSGPMPMRRVLIMLVVAKASIAAGRFLLMYEGLSLGLQMKWLSKKPWHSYASYPGRNRHRRSHQSQLRFLADRIYSRRRDHVWPPQQDRATSQGLLIRTAQCLQQSGPQNPLCALLPQHRSRGPLLALATAGSDATRLLAS